MLAAVAEAVSQPEQYDPELLVVLPPELRPAFEAWLAGLGLALARIPDLDDEANDHLLYLPAYEVRRA